MKTKNRIMALMLIFFLVFSNLKVVNAYEIRENAILTTILIHTIFN